jgi:hypothetical protein
VILKDTLGKLAEKWKNWETCTLSITFESGIESSVESGFVFLLAVLEKTCSKTGGQNKNKQK